MFVDSRSEDEALHISVVGLSANLSADIKIFDVREVSIAERLNALVQTQDLSIFVQESPVLVLEEREVFDRLEVDQHEIVAQEDGVVHQLAVVTKDVVTPTLWVHNAR